MTEVSLLAFAPAIENYEAGTCLSQQATILSTRFLNANCYTFDNIKIVNKILKNLFRRQNEL